MNNTLFNKPINGWTGQALLEYQVMVPWMAISLIIILPVLAGSLSSSFQTVADCFEGAQQQNTDACQDRDVDVPLNAGTSDENDTTSNSSSNTNSGSGSSSSSDTSTNNSSSSNNSDSSNNTNSSSSNNNASNSSGSSSGGSSSNTSGSSSGGGSDTGSSDGGSTFTPVDEEDLEDPNIESETGDENSSGGFAVGSCPATLTFEGLAAGTILNDQFEGVTITTHDPQNHPAMIFDTANPTGGDTDLGTPHSDFGGPGHGPGGAAGQIGENNTALGNVIIISEDGDTTDPDDNANGGEIIFTFDYPANVSYIYFLDQDNGGVAATLTLYDQSDAVLKSDQVNVPNNGGDNGVYRVDLETTGVYKLVATLPGSGALASVFFCEESEQENNADNSNTGDAGSSSSADNTDTSGTDNSGASSEPVNDTSPITGFMLVDADDASDLGVISDGQTIDLSTNVSIRADVSESVGSVVFSIDGNNIQTETAVPYAINGDSNGFYNAWDYPAGTYTLTATPYSQGGGNGDAGISYSMQITIAEPEPSATFIFVDDITGTSYHDNDGWRSDITVTIINDLGELVSGATVTVEFTRNAGIHTCTTDNNGQCDVTSDTVASNKRNVRASVTNVVSNNGIPYDSDSNNDNRDTINRP